MAKDSAAASNQTAEKLLLVLEALARQTQPVKLVDLAHQVGMNQSTCYRFVAALQNAGYAAQDKESGKYILNLKLCSLAEMIKDRVSVTSLLHAFVAEASALFQESAHLVQEENRQIVYIDNVTISSQSLITRQYIGRTAPMYCTGVGKLFLLEYSPEEFFEFTEADLAVIRSSLTKRPALQKNWFVTETAFYSNRPDNLVVIMDMEDGMYQASYGGATQESFEALMEVMEGLGEPI